MRRPLFPMVALVVVSLIVKECYPLSPFPMYSNLENGANYFYLEDSSGEALALKPNFGISGSDLKKKYYAYLNEVGEEQGVRKAYTLGDEAREEAGRRLLKDVRKRGSKRDEWKERTDRGLRLMLVQLTMRKAKIEEAPSLVLEEASP